MSTDQACGLRDLWPGRSTHLPGEQRYRDGVLAWNRTVTHEPALVVVARDATHVADVLRTAGVLREPVRVQSTGHGALAPAVGGVLLDVAGLSRVAVDPEARTASVGAGARWREVIGAAARYGLAPLSGSTGGLGAVGYTLGGGKGWLMRRYGLAADAVESAEIVTADGRCRVVDAVGEPDLFWALRGGGPNLGVVTELTMRLVPVTEVYAGGLYWPVERVRPVLEAFGEFTATVPDGVTSELDVLHLPPDPALPEPLRGASVVRVVLCSLDGRGPTDGLLAPLRRNPGLLLDTVGPMPFTELDSVCMEPVEPRPIRRWAGVPTPTGDARPAEAVLDAIAELAPRRDAGYVSLQLHHVGGGVRPPEDRAGLAYWCGDHIVQLVSVTPGPEAVAAARRAGADLAAALDGRLTGYVPFTFLGEDDPVISAFRPDHLRRLLEVKADYDPNGILGGDRALAPRVPLG
jgi:hypothetical protein